MITTDPGIVLHADDVARREEEQLCMVAKDLGVHMAAGHPHPEADAPSSQEALLFTQAAAAIRRSNQAIAADASLLARLIATRDVIEANRAEGRPTAVPDDVPHSPWRAVVLLFSSAAILFVALVDTFVLEPVWRDFLGTVDDANPFERFGPPVIVATIMVLLAFASARGADRFASGLTRRQRRRGLLVATGAGFALVPLVVLSTVIRTQGQRLLAMSNDQTWEPAASVGFLIAQGLIAGGTLAVSHVQHYAMRRFSNVRQAGWERGAVDLGNRASVMLAQLQGEMEQRRRAIGGMALKAWIVLRATVEVETTDPAAAPAWGARNRRDYRSLGLDVSVLADPNVMPEVPVDLEQIREVLAEDREGGPEVGDAPRGGPDAPAPDEPDIEPEGADGPAPGEPAEPGPAGGRWFGDLLEPADGRDIS